MKFGSFMEFHVREGSCQAHAFDESFAHVDMAEELGLDGVWLAEDHFVPDRSVLSAPLIIASAVAARTERIRIGTAVHVLPLGNPLRIAEEVASLDHVSQGRLEFGVGRSGIAGDYEGYNIPFGESKDRMLEYLDVILQAWTSERFSYAGRFHTFSDVCLVPKPYQSPHPPVRIAATSEETFATAARMGFPIFIGLRIQEMPQVAGHVDSYAQTWMAAGHPGPVDVALRVPVYVAETAERARVEAEESFMGQLRRLSGRLASSAAVSTAARSEGAAERGRHLTAISWEQVLREKVVVGSPEMVVERLQEMKETLRLSRVIAEFNAGDRIPRERIARSLRLFCERVIPAFK